MNRISSISAFALVCLLGAGCQTTIPIRSTQPGPISVGATKHIVLVKGDGRRSAREDASQEVIVQCRRRGFFSVEDCTEDPIFVQVAGGRVQVDGGERVLQEPDRAGLKIDVLELDCMSDTEQIEEHDPKTGKPYYREVRVRRGNVLLAITMFDTAGRAYVAEREYEGLATSRDPDIHREDLLRQAMSYAVGRFLGEITPRQVVTRVQMDEDDEGQTAIIDTAKAGNIGLAAQDAKAYAQANPQNSAAAYNLAVLLDAMGDYEEAMVWYDKALRLGTKSYYAAARAQCARRLRDRQTLQATPKR